MVVERIINVIKAEKRPSWLILIGFLYTSLALGLAKWTFAEQASMVFIFFTILGAIPLMYNIIKDEEKKDVSDFHEVALLKEHGKALMAFMALFVGITLAVAFWYTVLPGETTGQLFSTQIDTFNRLGGQITGYTGLENVSTFSVIFFNNLRVLIFCILFSFLYGAGAIFILTWNASIIGTAIGNIVRTNLASVASAVGLDQMGGYLYAVSLGLFRYVIHGIPEILSYFVAGLAGGIISIAVIRHDFEGRKFEHIVLDAADLLLIAIGLMFLAGVLEVWVTPLLFN
ncbi:stage II sporulation protein M [Candidatus Woesearchaeota archaeon]|nr:stage II sporulation protein M [Candidatus Woesearchaeota archaeon]